MNDLYTKAYTEVLEIIKYFPEDERKKIPKEEIDFYNLHKDKEYKFTINPYIDLAKQNISKEANAILIILFQDYFATDKQKEILSNLLNQNDQKVEQEKRKKYNPDVFNKKSNNIFDDNQVAEEKDELLLAEVPKETWYYKIWNYILSIFKK